MAESRALQGVEQPVRVLAYKTFQVSGAYPHDLRLAINDDGSLLTAFRAVADTGLPRFVHPFNQSLFQQIAKEAFALGKPPNYYTFGYAGT